MGFFNMNILKVIVFALTVHMVVIALPVSKSPKKDKEQSKNETSKENPEVLEYERYLREVVEALESDPEFRKKLDKSPEADIRNGKIAQELEYVNHNIRSKLDEIKRKEIDRLRHLASKQYELTNEIDREHLKIADHIDHKNEHTFEIKDLKKLILKTSQDLAEADKKRHDDFKEYEMQKEFEKQSVLKDLDVENRKKYEEELKVKKEEHQKHEKVHHPGNKAQLEEVWEKQDHMDGQDFDPKSFFMMHDVDGNGVWDETELKALFIKELDKVYASGTDDKRERAEEMERMREHVFSEIDTNRDGLVSYEEFLEQTKREEFQKDPEWETVDNVPQFTHDEYREFEKKREAELEQLISQGLLPPHPNLPDGYYPKSEVHGQQYIENNHIPQAQNPHIQVQHPQMHQEQVANPSLGYNQQIPNQQINHNGPNPGYNQQIPNQQINHSGPNPGYNQQIPNQQIPNQQINHNGPNPGYNQQIPNQQVNHNGPNPGYNQQIPNQQINHNGPNPPSGYNQQIPNQQNNHNQQINHIGPV